MGKTLSIILCYSNSFSSLRYVPVASIFRHLYIQIIMLAIMPNSMNRATIPPMLDRAFTPSIPIQATMKQEITATIIPQMRS